MQYLTSDVEEGVEGGLGRFFRAYANLTGQQQTGISNHVNQDSRMLLEDALSAWPAECEGRFVRLVTEFLTVASAVRKLQNEPPLTSDEFLCALGFSAWLLNSFKHQ